MRSRDPQLPKDPVLLIPWALPTKSEVLKLTASVKTERVDPSVQPPQPSPKRIAPSENVPPPPKRRKLSPEPCIDLSQARVKQEQKPEVKSFLEELKNVSAICHSAILLDCLLSYYSRNQPDIKVKVKNEMCMEELVYDRLHRNDIKNLKLELSLHMRTFTVTRKWMTGHLGGGMQTMVSKIAPEKTAKHGYDHFMYVNLAYHPDAPKRPGSAGLLYAIGGATAIPRIPPVARVFVNVTDAQSLYMAHYQIEEVEWLTLAEWNKVPEKVLAASNPVATLPADRRFSRRFDTNGRRKYPRKPGAGSSAYESH